MTLSIDDKRNVIEYRIEKAQQTLKEAKENAALGNWSLVANRLYYATFYMILAVNLSNGDTARTHNGTFNVFCKRFISTGLVTDEEGNLYRRLFSMRQSGDYEDLFDWSESEILPILPQVEAFITRMKAFISII